MKLRAQETARHLKDMILYDHAHMMVIENFQGYFKACMLEYSLMVNIVLLLFIYIFFYYYFLYILFFCIMTNMLRLESEK